MVYFVIYSLIFFFCSLMPSSLSAFIYEITVMRIPLSSDGSYYYFIGCSDFHDNSHAQALSQREQLLHIFDKANRLHTHIILEDLNSPNVHGKQGCKNFMLSCEKGVLAQLTQDLQRNGYRAENVEYRFGRVIALSEFLKNVEINAQSNPYNYASACALRVDDILHEVDDVLEEIQKYRDGVLCNALYAAGCEKIKQSLKQFKFLQQKEKSIATFCLDNSTVANRLLFLKQLLTFDTDLLDFKMLHSIVGVQNKQCAVVIAGGTHIAHLSELLKNVGFEQVEYCSYRKYSFEHVQPVSLELLQKYSIR